MDDFIPVEEDEAEAVLGPFWQEVSDGFADAGFHEPSELHNIIVTDEVRDSCRHFAAAREDGKVVYVASEIVNLPDESIFGILAHEAGHIIDFCNPGKFWYRKNGLQVVEKLPSKGYRKILKAWRERDDDEVEMVADEIAHMALGVRIGYVGSPSCLVQALGRGKRRPRGLR